MNATHPSKEQVRAYLAQRGLAHVPPPSPEEIRRRLDWRADPPVFMPPMAFVAPAMLEWGTWAVLGWMLWPLALAKNTKK